MYRINEKLINEGKLQEGHCRVIGQGWKKTPAELKELAGFDIEEEIGAECWFKAVLTDERRNKVAASITYAEIYYTESYEEYKKFICMDVKKIADSYNV